MSKITKKFQILLDKYESYPLMERDSKYYYQMKEIASNVAEWDIVRKYGRSSNEYDALQGMKECASYESTDAVDMLRLKEFLGDYEWKKAIAAFYNSHSAVDDLLFVCAFAGSDDATDALLRLPYDELEDKVKAVKDAMLDTFDKFLDRYQYQDDGRFACSCLCNFKGSLVYEKAWNIAEGNVM